MKRNTQIIRAQWAGMDVDMSARSTLSACTKWAAARRIGRYYLRGTRRYFGCIMRLSPGKSALLWTGN